MSTPTDIELIITDESNLRTWRTEIPNIIDDLGLDPYQERLYTHYKRVCGAAGGTCTQGVRRVANTCKMSTAKVSIARRELAAKGLIIEHPQPAKPGHKHGQVHVTIPDIWRLNFLYFSFKKRPDIDGWTIAQLEAWANTVYVVNGDDEEEDTNRLPGKRPVYGVNGDEGGNRLPGKQKKEHVSSKKELDKKNGADAPPKRAPTGRNAIKAELETHYCTITKHNPPPTDTKAQRKAAGQLWWNPLLRIYDACDDLDEAKSWITTTVRIMDRDNLQNCNPNSIIKVALAEIAKHKRTGGNGRNGNANSGRGDSNVLPAITREQGEHLRRELRARKQAAGG